MEAEKKKRLERLKKLNKVKIAKEQLVSDLSNKYNVDISTDIFFDYDFSEKLHKEVYKIIKSDKKILEKFKYNAEIVDLKLDQLFERFKSFEGDSIVFYPSAFGFYYRGSKQLYLDYPISTVTTINDCKEHIRKLVHDIYDDIIVVDKDLRYGFVISEDEYCDVWIEYWGTN